MEIIAMGILIVVGVVVETKIYKKYILPYITYSCNFSKHEVVEGEELDIIEVVTNPSRFVVPCLKSEITTSKYLAFAGDHSVINDKHRSLASLFFVRGRQKVTRIWHTKCLKRGVYHVEDTTIVANDLLQHYEYSALIKGESELVVLPRGLDVLNHLISPRNQQGERVVKRFILPDPFYIAGVRAYQERDGMNKIHWGITARQGQLMVRNNEPTAKDSITIALNMQSDLLQMKEVIYGHKIEIGIRIAAGILESTVENGIPVRLMVNGLLHRQQEEIITKELYGGEHIHELLIALAKLELEHTQNFNQFLNLNEDRITSTDLILITCFLDDEMICFIRQKQYEGIRVKVCMVSCEEEYNEYEDIEVYYLLDTFQEEVTYYENLFKESV